MKTKMMTLAASLLLATVGLTGCDNDDRRGAVMPPPPAPPPPAPVVFSDFVRDQFAATADDTDPVPVDDVDFEFDAGDDPDAFDELLAPDQ